MAKSTDIRVVGTQLFFLPVETRVPLKFGPETLTHVTCARARLTVQLADGRTANGWGETPLSVQWVWPSALPYEPRHEALNEFCQHLAKAWSEFDEIGHPLELGHDFQQTELPRLLAEFNQGQAAGEPIPWLAALVCCSLFDIALHDALGQTLGQATYDTYSAEYLSRDLGQFLQPAAGSNVQFDGRFPSEFLDADPPTTLPAWHLVGGLDPLDESELSGNEPDDGYPVLLADWIRTDGLTCLKIKLRGNDAEWDYDRLVNVGTIAIENGVLWLTADFNCTVTDPVYCLLYTSPSPRDS